MNQQTCGRDEDRRLSLMVQLECLQYLHFFQPVESIPPEVVEHVAGSLGFAPRQQVHYPEASGNGALYRDHDKVRAFLKVRSYSRPKARAEAVRTARRVSDVVNTVVDVIVALPSARLEKECFRNCLEGRSPKRVVEFKDLSR